LKEWLIDDFSKIKIEQPLYVRNEMFIPDLSCYKKTISNIYLDTIYEVIHKNDLNGHKLNKIQMYQYYNNVNLNIYSVNADYILNQTSKPESILKFNYSSIINE
jgi:hypothetical protein